MATKKQKEELIKALKFTPCTYTLTISGYGGESYAGVVDRKVYEYFKDKKIDINQYAWEWDEELWQDIPDDMRPFEPGSAYDCDNIWHASGAELSDLNYITVSNETGETHLEQPCSYNLEDHGVTVTCSNSYEVEDLDEGTVVFWGGQGEKGCFFDGEINLTAPFDPAKLTIYFEDCDGWSIICSVEYDGEEIDGSGGYSTTGKWSDAKWLIAGGEEVYEGEERTEPGEAPEEEDNGLTSFQTLANTLAEANWNDISVKPPAKGTYECKFSFGAWPLGNIRNAEWTGRSWKENGKKAPEILGWREVDQ